MGDIATLGGPRQKGPAAILAAIDWIYDRAVGAIPGFHGAFDDTFTAPSEAGDAAIDALIRRHILEASAAGFLANLGGIMTLPVAIPANLGSVLFIQLRMIARIAHLRGYDVHSPKVKSLALACLAGSAAFDVFKDTGVALGARLSRRAIAQLSTTTVARLNRGGGFALAAKAGARGAATLAKLVPFAGGAVGGTIDGLTTAAIATAAKRVFNP